MHAPPLSLHDGYMQRGVLDVGQGILAHAHDVLDVAQGILALAQEGPDLGALLDQVEALMDTVTALVDDATALVNQRPGVLGREEGFVVPRRTAFGRAPAWVDMLDDEVTIPPPLVGSFAKMMRYMDRMNREKEK